MIRTKSLLNIPLPEGILRALGLLEAAGFEGWLVGGCVRDAVMGLPPHDYDLAVSSRPEETMEVFRGFRVIETGLKHGTVTVLIDGEAVEMTTYRVDGEYTDCRHPDSVRFTRSIRDDLSRRDFTMNAMAYHPARGLYDPFSGVDAISEGRISCVGEAEKRFSEDALRIMRALRFASQLGFALDDETRAAALVKKELLGGISVERLFSELCGLLCGKEAGQVVLDSGEIIAQVIPELAPTIGFDQRSRYHCYDVYEHTARAVGLSSPDRLVRLTLLLHDIGKPHTAFFDERGGHFHGHESLGAQMADRILERMHSDNATRRTVVMFIEEHDKPLIPDEKHVRRLLSRMSPDNARRLLEVKRADRLAHAPEYRETEEIEAFSALLDRMEKESLCCSTDALLIKGSDLIELGMTPGKELGALLAGLLGQVIDGELPNERDALLARAREMIKNAKTDRKAEG